MYTSVIILLSISLISFFITMATGNSNRKKKDELLIKNEQLKRELQDISIKQVVALNGMLENNAISLEDYYIMLNKVYQQCLKYGIDISILQGIKPSPILNKEVIIHKILNTASTLHDTNNLDDTKYDQIINDALDNKSKFNK